MKSTVFLLIFLISISTVSAQTLNVLKEEYITGETLQADINIEDFSISNLKLRDLTNSTTSVGFLSFKKEENNYHVYFNLPNALQTNTTYKLEYTKDTIILKDQFKIINGSKVISITPPIVQLSNSGNNFKISVSNKGKEDVEVSISATEVTPARDSLSLVVGETKNLFVNYKKPFTGPTLTLTYGTRSYNVKLLLPKEETSEGTTKSNKLILIDTTPLSHSITQQQTIAGKLEFKNSGTTPLTDITFHTTPKIANLIDFNISKFIKIEPNQIYEQFIWINKNKKAIPGVYTGTILLKSKEGDSTSIGVTLTINEELIDIAPLEEESNIIITPQNPEENTFNVTPITTLENGIVEGIVLIEGDLPDEKKNKNKTIGIILLVILLTVAGIIIWKLRPKKAKREFKEYIAPLKKGVQKQN